MRPMDITSHCLLSSLQEPSKCLFSQNFIEPSFPLFELNLFLLLCFQSWVKDFYLSSCQRQKLLSNKFILYAWIQKHEWLVICEEKYFIISIFRRERRDARGSSEIIKIQNFKTSWWKVKNSLPPNQNQYYLQK